MHDARYKDRYFDKDKKMIPCDLLPKVVDKMMGTDDKCKDAEENIQQRRRPENDQCCTCVKKCWRKMSCWMSKSYPQPIPNPLTVHWNTGSPARPVSLFLLVQVAKTLLHPAHEVKAYGCLAQSPM